MKRLVIRWIAWWKWAWKDGWELVEIEPTGYVGSNWLWPLRATPYFIERWKNTETGEIREVERG